MITIRKLELGAVPRIVVPLSDVEVRRDTAAVKPYADIFELRVDQFDDPTPDFVCEVCAEAAASGLPLLGTVRRSEEGGRACLDDARRLRLFETLVPLVDAIDIEFRAPIRLEVTALARRHGRPVIVSYHDFERTPPDEELVAMIARAKEQGADIVKLAVTARSLADTDRALGLLRAHRAKQLVVIAMGEHGATSRVFFPLFGSLLTYGFARQANAPGQISAEALFAEFMRYSPEFSREKAEQTGT